MHVIWLLILAFDSFLSTNIVEAKLHTNEFAVHIPGGEQKAKNVAEQHGFVFKGQIGSLEDYYLFEHDDIRKRSLTPSLHLFEVLNNDSSILWVEQQEVKHRVKRRVSGNSVTFRDPLYPEQWFLHNGGYGGFDMNVIPAWEKGYTGKGIVVSILDDGIQSNHPDLAQNYDKDASYDINDSDDDPNPQDDDDNKHGTRCAGEVASVANNEFCGVGIAYNSSIGGVRMLDGSVTDSIEATALSLRPNHIHIYSASWGPEDDGKTVDGPGKMAKVAFEKGIIKGRNGLGSIFVWASGNGGRHSDNCNCDGYTNSVYTISVSSATQSGLMPWYLEQCSSTLATTYSSGASDKDMNIVTVDVDYSYTSGLQSGLNPPPSKLCTKSHTGTSASAPIAAAICALSLQANPQLTWRDIQYLIVMTSRYEPLSTETGWITNAVGRKVSTKFGYGLMDAHAMVMLAKKWKTLPEQHICNSSPDPIERIIPATQGEKLEASIDADGCDDTKNIINFLEHVQVVITLAFHPRGNLLITLVSPSGTRSPILLPRPRDKIDRSFNDWPFMSVHFWGEVARGRWTLVIESNGTIAPSGPGKLYNWSLVFYGTEHKPMNLATRKEFKTNAFTIRGINKFTEADYDLCADHKEFENTVNGEMECVHKCPVGQYGDLSGYTCRTCDVSCLSCYGPSFNNCMACSKLFLYNGTCVKSCPDGFFADSDSHQCVPCLPTCDSCDASRNCFSCKSDFFLYNHKCFPTCPYGTYGLKEGCKSCHHSCLTCFGPLSSNCLTCSSSYVLYNNTCIQACPEEYYVNDYATCIRCHRSCGKCLEVDSCTKCPWDRDDSICAFNSKCRSAWYNHDIDACEACSSNCEECLGPDSKDCVLCKSGHFWLESQCIEECPEGYYINEDECIPCSNLCLKCDNIDNCLLCKEGFVLHSGKCHSSCPEGFYDNEQRECDGCHSECLTCFGSSNLNCTTCRIGYLVNHKCETLCSDGFFPLSNEQENFCFPCYITCKTCSEFGPSHCISCYKNSSFIEGSCIPCLDGEFYNEISQSCERCHGNCGRCFGPNENNCLSCRAQFRLQKEKHVCLPCCKSEAHKEIECCTCSKDLDVCVNSNYAHSTVNIPPEEYNELLLPLKHIVPIVITICISVVLLYLLIFGLLQAKAHGWCYFTFGRPKYERVPSLAAKFDADSEKVSLTQEELEDEDDIYERV